MSVSEQEPARMERAMDGLLFPYDEYRRTRRGDVVLNPVTGERATVLAGTGDGSHDRLAVLLRVRVGGAVVGEHVHPHSRSDFMCSADDSA